jgi:hypothetical protein
MTVAFMSLIHFLLDMRYSSAKSIGQRLKSCWLVLGQMSNVLDMEGIGQNLD